MRNRVKLTESRLNTLIEQAIYETIEQHPEFLTERGLVRGLLRGAQAQWLDQKAAKMAEKLKAQEEQSKAIIAKEQEKLKALRTQYNELLDRSQTATDKANKHLSDFYGQERTDFGRTQRQRMDVNQQDFYTSQEMNQNVQKAEKSARASERGKQGVKAKKAKAQQAKQPAQPNPNTQPNQPTQPDPNAQQQPDPNAQPSQPTETAPQQAEPAQTQPNPNAQPTQQGQQ